MIAPSSLLIRPFGLPGQQPGVIPVAILPALPGATRNSWPRPTSMDSSKLRQSSVRTKFLAMAGSMAPPGAPLPENRR